MKHLEKKEEKLTDVNNPKKELIFFTFMSFMKLWWTSTFINSEYFVEKSRTIAPNIFANVLTQAAFFICLYIIILVQLYRKQSQHFQWIMRTAADFFK